MKLNLRLINEDIPVEVVLRKRKTMEIQIGSKANLRVLAPLNAKKEDIINVLNKKTDWIIKNLRLVESRKEITKNATEKKEISILGDVYSMEIIDANENKLIFINDILTVFTKANDHSYIEDQINEWLKKVAYEKVKERLDLYSYKMDLRYKKLVIKDQKTRWGSCSSLGNININYRIVNFPLEIVDYLVVHELSHLKYMNHSKEFWNFVENWIPDYKNRRNMLKNTGKNI